MSHNNDTFPSASDSPDSESTAPENSKSPTSTSPNPPNNGDIGSAVAENATDCTLISGESGVDATQTVAPTPSNSSASKSSAPEPLKAWGRFDSGFFAFLAFFYRTVALIFACIALLGGAAVMTLGGMRLLKSYFLAKSPQPLSETLFPLADVSAYVIGVGLLTAALWGLGGVVHSWAKPKDEPRGKDRADDA